MGGNIGILVTVKESVESLCFNPYIAKFRKTKRYHNIKELIKIKCSIYKKVVKYTFLNHQKHHIGKSKYV